MFFLLYEASKCNQFEQTVRKSASSLIVIVLGPQTYKSAVDFSRQEIKRLSLWFLSFSRVNVKTCSLSLLSNKDPINISCSRNEQP